MKIAVLGGKNTSFTKTVNDNEDKQIGLQNFKYANAKQESRIYPSNSKWFTISAYTILI